MKALFRSTEILATGKEAEQQKAQVEEKVEQGRKKKEK